MTEFSNRICRSKSGSKLFYLPFCKCPQASGCRPKRPVGGGPNHGNWLNRPGVTMRDKRQRHRQHGRHREEGVSSSLLISRRDDYVTNLAKDESYDNNGQTPLGRGPPLSAELQQALICAAPGNK
eukprot:g38570.t1